MMQVGNQFKQQLQLQQRQILAPQMQQSLQLLQMSSIELEQFVEQALETNPFLERATANETTLTETTAHAVAENHEMDDRMAQEYEESVLGMTENTPDPEPAGLDFRDPSERHREGEDFSRNPDADEIWQYMQDSITRDESLKSHLLDQMRFTASSPGEYAIGERIIIGNIDDRGYFSGSIAEIAGELNLEESAVAAVLDTIKHFEPTGVGAADLVECLLLQIEMEYPEEEPLRQLVAQHWLDLQNGRYPQIAQAMNISMERVLELRAMIARLDPYPGRQYSSEPPSYIEPEVAVEEVEGDYIVVLISDHIPVLMLNGEYVKEVRSKKLTREEQGYLRENIDAAHWLIRNIERRQDTVLKTAQAIVDAQREFMKKGVSCMKPLTLSEIAEKVGVHESTISRTVNGKYMQTPQGLFELKYFFSSGLRSDDGENQSSTAICALIKEIIEQEDKRKPYSDQKIADLLKEQGTNIARRTITKYREQMNIFPAKMRRTY